MVDAARETEQLSCRNLFRIGAKFDFPYQNNLYKRYITKLAEAI